jgi:hypothetical protein
MFVWSLPEWSMLGAVYLYLSLVVDVDGSIVDVLLGMECGGFRDKVF